MAKHLTGNVASTSASLKKVFLYNVTSLKLYIHRFTIVKNTKPLQKKQKRIISS